MKEEKNNVERIHQLSRLKWACRRGMLELDVLLGNFLSEGYPSLTDEDKWLFVRLLEYPDPELHHWLMSSEKPEDPGLASMTEKIKQHAKARL